METGAELQNTFGDFIEKITPKVIEITKALVKALQPVVKNLDLIVVSVGALVAGAALGALVKGFIALKVAIAGVTTVSGLLLLNPIFGGAAAVAGIVAGIYAINKALRGQAEELERIKRAGAAEGATGAEKAEAISVLKKQIAEQGRIIEANPEGTGQGRAARSRRRIAAQEEKRRLERQLASVTRVRKPTRKGDGDFQYDPVSADGGDKGTKSKLARRVEQAQALENRMQRQLLLAQQQTQLGRFLARQDNQRSVLQEKIAKLKKGEVTDELRRATASAVSLQNEQLALDLKKKVSELSEKATQDFDKAIKGIADKVKEETRYAELIKKGINPERAKEIINLEKLKKLALDELDILIDQMRVRVAKRDATQEEIDLLDELLKKRKDVEETDPEETTKPLEKARNEFEEFKDVFKKGLEEMTQIGPQLANVALSAIDSVTDGIVQLITTGKANFKEMAASILADIAKIMIRSAIAKALLGFFPAANGAVLDAGRVKPYAKGGIVTGPTVFPMVQW